MATRRVLTSLRAVCGNLTLAEIVHGREKVSREVLRSMKRWGKAIRITNVEIKNIKLPKEMERSMASEALSSRQAMANVISADGENRASRALKEAADIVATSPSAFQLHYMHTLRNISKSKNKTIIFPFPPQVFELISREYLEHNEVLNL